MKLKQLISLSKSYLQKSNIEDFNLKIKLLIEYVFDIKKEQIILNYDREIDEDKVLEFNNLLEKVKNGVPVQYIINKQEFMGLNFYVDENVLIPQPDTEILVEEVMSLYPKESKLTILDLCTGSGCIGISLAKYFVNSRVYLSDVSKEALSIAEKNGQKNHVDNIQILQSNLFENIPNELDVIVSNPPYIPSKEIPFLPEEVQKEPHIALDGGIEGLDFYQKIIRESPKFLKDKGYLCLEMGYDQKEKIASLLEKSNAFQKYYTKKDLAGIDRVIVAQKK